MNKLRAFFYDGDLKTDRVLVALALAVALISLLALAFPALGLNGRRPPVTLTVAEYWSRNMEEGVLESIARDFHEAEPSIKVRFVAKTRDEIRAALLESVAVTEGDGGAKKKAAPPFDIAAFDPVWEASLAASGALWNLTDLSAASPVYVTEDGEEVAKIEEWALYSADPWALPVAVFAVPLYYNSALLQEAGFDRPPKNKSAFLDACRAVEGMQTVNGAVSALVVSSDLRASVFPWYLAEGSDTDKTADFFLTLRNEGLSPHGFELSSEEAFAEFCAGKAAFWTAPTSYIRRVRASENPPAFSVTTIPQADDFFGKSPLPLGAWYCGIAAKSAHPVEAMYFVRYLAGRRAEIERAAGAVPGNLRTIEAESGDTSENSAGLSEAAELDRDEIYAKARAIYDGTQAVPDWSLLHIDDTLAAIAERVDKTSR